MGVLEKDRAISGKELKGGSNTFSGSFEGASLTTLDSRGIEDSQLSLRLD